MVIDLADRTDRTLRCDNCGSQDSVTRSLDFDLCPACVGALKAEHEIYAREQARRMSTDAMRPV